MLTCPSCGQENPDGFRFCGACAALLAAELPARREERKVVTVLFCDLVGSTARADGVDPEDVRALLSHYHARVRAELERFGGTVEKFIGDAVVAVFGAPTAHEDDPERAVRAALAIREWANDEHGLELRIAVNTGEALVTLAARPEEGEGMVAGDVVNTAARLQEAAPTNGILAGETTYRATRGLIDYREAVPVEAKGKTDRDLLPGEVEERDQLDGDRQGAAADHAHAGQPLHRHLLDQGDGGTFVHRQIRARAARELDRGYDAEKGDTGHQLVGDLPRPLAPRPLASAHRDANLADGTRLHHRHEQGAHRPPLDETPTSNQSTPSEVSGTALTAARAHLIDPALGVRVVPTLRRSLAETRHAPSSGPTKGYEDSRIVKPDPCDGAATDEDQPCGAVVPRFAAIASMAARSSALTPSPPSR
ncbi:MAG TPA: adenylate/guanylate cyclase domain-containing protein [Gaiellaceae bacterium]|jgi:class 3 adenylate cyclase